MEIIHNRTPIFDRWLAKQQPYKHEEFPLILRKGANEEQSLTVANEVEYKAALEAGWNHAKTDDPTKRTVTQKEIDAEIDAEVERRLAIRLAAEQVEMMEKLQAEANAGKGVVKVAPPPSAAPNVTAKAQANAAASLPVAKAS